MTKVTCRLSYCYLSVQWWDKREKYHTANRRLHRNWKFQDLKQNNATPASSISEK